MNALGKMLANETNGVRHAMVFVYDDRKAASMRQQGTSGTLSASDQSHYDRHCVAIYNRNENTGVHKMEVFFDGVSGTNHKTISY